jgi:hypothetical protein
MSLLRRLLKSKQELPDRPMLPVPYPSGVCVGDETGKWFYIKGQYKIPITSHRVLQSWSFATVIRGSEDSLSGFHTTTGPLGFRDGTLLKNFADGKMYLVSENKVRHIVNPDWLEWLGLQDYNVIHASDDEIKLHEEGDVLS